ncbi:winged helix-turn-helix transcriptional regulator [Spongiibacter sp. KMU-166]|uniref:Winged helix-turn-helix transcriptional regulator n=1 Tax=Spongiibacter thalassae TaxID=2721624 RepID=A0ABX1GAA8_9GAMM|nr:MarR family winged helix-turn-helix transcriptional regulator [Spongiibacter thalassae]NKI15885.1 winged helix-turn-helix transcriptional regulator [Spongiibacter thalassae]
MARTNKRANDKAPEEIFQELLGAPHPASLLPLTLNIFYWVDDSLQNLLKKNGWPSITRLQSQVLTCLEYGLIRTTDIAKHVGVSRQVVNRCVNELVDLNLLELNPDPDDKRAKVISPTAEGQRIVLCALESLEMIEKTLAERIGKENLESLRTILEMPRGAPLE